MTRKASRAAERLTPWVRRALAHEPSVTRLRLTHCVAIGRPGLHLEDHPVAEPRTDVSAEDIAAAIVEAATAHADSFGGRQVYEVIAIVEDEDDPAARTQLVIVASAEAAFDGTSEPTDMRSFGAMASRHSESFARLMLQSNQATIGALTTTLDRLSSRLERAETRVEQMADHVFATTEARLSIEADRAKLAREREESETDAQIKVELWGLVQQCAPLLLPLVAKAGQKLLAAPKPARAKRRKRTKRPTPRPLGVVKP